MTGPVGSIMLWRRMAFFGAALAEGSVVGVVIAVVLFKSTLLGATVACIALALFIDWLRLNRHLTDDTLIGVVGHAALALAFLIASAVPRIRLAFLDYLFGDILAATPQLIFWGGAIAVGVLIIIFGLWRSLVLSSAEPAIAAAEGVRINALYTLYSLLLACVIAVGLQLVGALLIVALLIMPAAAARPLAGSPIAMAVIAFFISLMSSTGGIWLSQKMDFPAGPTIALIAAGAFAASLAVKRLRLVR